MMNIYLFIILAIMSILLWFQSFPFSFFSLESSLVFPSSISGLSPPVLSFPSSLPFQIIINIPFPSIYCGVLGFEAVLFPLELVEALQ
jgi:hypothetical protein